MANVFLKSNITGGGFQDSQGNPLSLGYLTFQLSHDSNISVLGGPNGSQIVAGIATKMFLDMNGNLIANQSLWTNDVLTPAGSYYLVTAYDYKGILQWLVPQIFYIQPYSPTINIGSIIPSTP